MNPVRLGIFQFFCFIAYAALQNHHLELYQQIREPDVLHRIKPSCGSHAQSAGQIGFAAAGGSQQDDVVVLLNVGDFAERCTHSSTALCFTSR